MELVWLDGTAPFPPAHLALDDPPGLLAAGGDLSLARLRAAYAQGIFPWYSDGQPILWWSPDPRMVLRVEDFHPSHSLRKRLRQIARAEQRGDFSTVVRVDSAFPEVMRACARKSTDDQPGTWITFGEVPGLTTAQLLASTVIGRLPWLPAWPQNVLPRFLRLLFTPVGAFTVGDQLLWGAAEPLRRMLGIVRQHVGA